MKIFTQLKIKKKSTRLNLVKIPGIKIMYITPPILTLIYINVLRSTVLKSVKGGKPTIIPVEFIWKILKVFTKYRPCFYKLKAT